MPIEGSKRGGLIFILGRISSSMKNLKKWYTYKRDGIIYVQFKDKITGKKLTAKSTGTKDKKEAEEIINKWYYDPDSFYNMNKKSECIKILKRLIKELELSDEELLNILGENLSDTSVFNSEKNNGLEKHVKKNLIEYDYYDDDDDDDISEEIAEIKKIRNLTFKNYLLLFWDYDKSPYIKHLYRLGKNPPNPERFYNKLKTLKKYEYLLDNTLLRKVKPKKINLILGKIKKDGNLKETSISGLRYSIVQALNFAYENGIMNYSITKKITSFSNENEKKEIFKKEELKALFKSKNNPFGDEKYKLLNELLFKTGCRVGEIQALQIKDLIKTEIGYSLNIDKNYCKVGKRLKETKTKRSDLVAISDKLAESILEFIKMNPYKNKDNSFIFYSEKEGEPLSYSSIYKNFNSTMKNLGFKRKNLTLHSYRHTYATILLDSDFSELDLLFLTRHDDIKQVLHYSKHESKKKELKRLKAVDVVEAVA